MTEPEDIDVLAGEYVLGTLDPGERASVAARRARDPALDAAICAWEAQLGVLDEATSPVAPPPDLLTGIEQRIAGAAPGGDGVIVELAQLRQRVTVWRRFAMAACATAAALLVTIGLRETVLRDRPLQYVGVFQKDDVLPSFYLTIDLKARELTLRPVGAERQPGKTYQLWIASEQLGPAPQSLGLVDDALEPTRKSLGGFDRSLLQKATFGVSLEPAGGSPTGRPSPGALHTKLLPVSN